MKPSQKRYFRVAYSAFVVIFTFLLWVQGVFADLTFAGTVLLTAFYLLIAGLLWLYVKKNPDHFR